MSTDTRLWVGLGNPGAKYAGHRHNIGFMAVEEIARSHHFPPFKSKFQGLASEGLISIDGKPVKVLLLKPTTFMNESGRSVQAAVKFYKIPLEHIVVFHDELDIAPGKFRMKTGGGIAGHNGLRSIRQHIGENFHRGRLGIGHPGHKDKVHGYVLSDFAKSETAMRNAMCDGIARYADLLANDKRDLFQTRVMEYVAPALKG